MVIFMHVIYLAALLALVQCDYDTNSSSFDNKGAVHNLITINGREINLVRIIVTKNNYLFFVTISLTKFIVLSK